MAREELVVGNHVDPDFGALELIETCIQVAVNSGPKTPLVFRQWSGKHAELDAAISIDSDEDPLFVSDNIRADFRRVISNVEDFTLGIALGQLGLAKDWVAQAGTDLPLDGRKLATLLKISGFTIGPRRLTVWIEESANIFAGHVLEVRIEMGEIKEICLAG